MRRAGRWNLGGLATQIVESTNLSSHGLGEEKRGDEASDDDSSTRWHVGKSRDV